MLWLTYEHMKTLPPSLPFSRYYRLIYSTALLFSKAAGMLNTALAWTLIPHCLLICTKNLEMDDSKGGSRLCGKVITQWCKAGPRWGFSTSSKGNEILIWVLFHFYPPQASSFPSILPITRFINVILDIICIMYVRDLYGWPDFALVSRSDKVSLTQRPTKPSVWPEIFEKNFTDVSKCS